MVEVPEYMRRKDAANYLKSRYGVGSSRTLAKLAVTGGGPIMTKIGGAACYLKDDLDDWARSRMTRWQSTSVALDTNLPLTSPAAA